MLFARYYRVFSPASVRISGLRLALAFALALCAPMVAAAHEHGQTTTGWGSEGEEYEPQTGPYSFTCIVTGGATLASWLPEDCKKWWPGCTKKVPPPKVRFPRHCETPRFKVIHVPTANGDEYIHHHQYSQSNSKPGMPYGQYSQSYRKRFQKSGSDNESGDNESSGGSGSNFAGGKKAAFTSDTLLMGGGQSGKSGGIKEASRSAPSMGTEGGALGAGGAGTAGKGLGSGETAGAGAAGSPEAGTSGSAATDPAAGKKESTYQAFLAGKFSGASAKEQKFETSGEALPENDSITKNHAGYTDPWMDYVTASSREELIDRLVKNSKLREELQQKLDDINDGSGASDPMLKEKKEYYRNALLEAKNRLRRGTLEALAPLDSYEAFSMNGDETDREIKRLLSSMDEGAAELSDKDEGLHYPLFPRVHRALWRQLANGNINLKTKTR